jgi:hypothetical protein
MEGRKGFEHLELLQAIGMLGGIRAVPKFSPGDGAAVGDGLRQV